jgi:hypothetical protein
MNRILTFTSVIILLVVGSLFAETIEAPVSQVAVISPGENEEDLTLGPRVCLSFTLPQSLQGREIGRAELVLSLGQMNDITEDSILVFGSYVAGSIKPRNTGELCLDISEMVRLWNSQRRDNYGLILIPRDTEFNGFRAFRYSAAQLRSMVSLKIIVPGRDG